MSKFYGNKPVLLFTAICLIFIYTIQYILYRQVLILDNIVFDNMPTYDWFDWVEAYAFVITSSLLIFLFLIIGLSGRIRRAHPVNNLKLKKRKIGIPLILFVFALFFLWSYIMLKLKVGMTIYTDFDPLPFKLIGLLFYGRLFLQPIILTYISCNISGPKKKILFFILLVSLGFFISLISGSRFLGVLFAMPIFFLFKGRVRFLICGVVALSFITVATYTRSFFLPYVLTDQHVQIYANEETKSLLVESGILLPFSYAVRRVMGMNEVLMTLKFGEICPSFMDSLLSFSISFLPLISSHDCKSFMNVYGLDDDAVGGFALDLFSNYWVLFGGNIFLYFAGLALVGLIMGKCYRYFCVVGYSAGFPAFPIVAYAVLFLIVFEARTPLLVYIFLFSWFFSRDGTLKILSSFRWIRRRTSFVDVVN